MFSSSEPSESVIPRRNRIRSGVKNPTVPALTVRTLVTRPLRRMGSAARDFTPAVREASLKYSVLSGSSITFGSPVAKTALTVLWRRSPVGQSPALATVRTRSSVSLGSANLVELAPQTSRTISRTALSFAEASPEPPTHSAMRKRAWSTLACSFPASCEDAGGRALSLPRAVVRVFDVATLPPSRRAAFPRRAPADHPFGL